MRWGLTISIPFQFFFWTVPCLNAQVSMADSLFDAATAEDDPNEKARIFLELSQLTSSTDPVSALEHINQATELADDDDLLGDIYDQKGRVHFALGELDEALNSFREAKRSKEQVGNETAAAGINNRVGVALFRLKRHQEALEVFLESAAFFEEAGDDVNLAMCHNNMAGIFADMGDFENAVRYNELALPVFQENGIQQYEIITLTNLAVKYLSENYAAIPVLVLSMFDQEEEVIDMLKAGAAGYILKKAGKDELVTAIQKLVNRGHYYSPSISAKVNKWLENPGLIEEATPLTKRERQILKLIADGKTSQQIARSLKISKYTVDTHRKNIHKKLDIKTNTGLVKYVLENL